MVNFLARSVLIAVLVGMVHAQCDVTEVLKENGSILGADNLKKSYHGGKCQITFPRDGKLIAGTAATNDKFIDFAPNPKTVCTSTTLPVRYKLQTDGNFVFRCTNNSVVYNTHSAGDTGSYSLVIDKYCKLHTYIGAFNCDALDSGVSVWDSHKSGRWGINQKLYMGQVYLGLPPYQLVLSPSTGKLEARYPTSSTTFKVVWTSNTTPGSIYEDYYAKLTPGGRLILMEIDYQGTAEKEYYSKTLEGKAACYYLSFKKLDTKVDGPIELIAKAC